MRLIKASALGLVLGMLATSALAAEPAKCCCKEKAEKMACCDKKDDAKPADQPTAPDQHQQHNH